ncbi:glycosyltransferase family 32 protein [Nemania abortiva]|nr:glycosyltransferase family 32 protein [Nemania abortiva]
MDNPHLYFRRRRTSFIALLVFVLLVAVNWRYFYNLGDRVRQTRPGSYQYEVEKDIVPTDDELDCLYGKTAPINDHSIERIPNNAHFIFGLSNPYDGDTGSFDFLAFLAVRSAVVGLQASRIFLHYTYLANPPSPEPNKNPFSNPWVNRLKDKLTLVYHPPEESNKIKDKSGARKAAHIADVLRLQILSEQGGIYLDMDAFTLRPFTNILNSPRDIFMGHEGGNRAGMANAIIVARAGSTFIDRWIAEYDHIDFEKEWNYHSVIFPKELQHEAHYWTEQIELNGGSPFNRQPTYHA